MRTKFARSLALIALFLLGGCAGADFKLPQFTSVEVERAALAIRTDAGGPATNARSDDENRMLVSRVNNRLRDNIAPLCRQAEIDPCWFDVTYDADDDVNAYAEGDNRIHIMRGLLHYLDSEEEVAAVVAHEIGHHLGDHISEKKANATIGAILGGIIMGAAMVAGGYDPAYDRTNAGSEALSGAMNMGAAVGALSYSKSQEREADLLAAYILARAGYDLDRAGEVWVVLAQMDDTTHASLLDTHPAGPERVVAWEKAVAEVRASPDLLPDTD